MEESLKQRLETIVAKMCLLRDLARHMPSAFELRLADQKTYFQLRVGESRRTLIQVLAGCCVEFPHESAMFLFRPKLDLEHLAEEEQALDVRLKQASVDAIDDISFKKYCIDKVAKLLKDLPETEMPSTEAK